MGTNYYWYKNKLCPTCQQATSEPKHIGKSSSGWCFSLKVHPDESINGLGTWEILWALEGSYIKNQYGERIDREEMSRIIRDRTWERKHLLGHGFHELNNSEDGPNGLLRHRVNGRHCIGHGAGTWDLIVGDFS